MSYASFTFSELPGKRVLTVAGEIDISNSAELNRSLADTIDDVRPTVVDLSECRFLDSSCLEVLVRKKNLYGHNLTLVIPAGAVIRKVFVVTNLLPKFNIVPSLAEAQTTLEDAG